MKSIKRILCVISLCICKLNSTFSNVEILPIQVNFQQPTYLLQKEQTSDIYECDYSKPECKINLDITPTFGNTSASFFRCHIDFGFETLESEKCNPGTVIMPIGETHLHIQVSEKDTPSNAQQKNIVIKNTPPTSSTTQTILDASEILAIPDIIYTLQTPSHIERVSTGSQIFETGSIDTYVCDKTKSECSVNFSLEDTFGGYIPKKFTCENIFGLVTGEEGKCNPNTIIFPEGEFIVTFKIYEILHPENAKSTTIKIIHSPQKSDIPDPIITVQSGLSLEGEIYQCKTKECSVNFTAQDSFTGEFVEQNYTCAWDFGSGSVEMSTSCNPGYIHFPQGSQKVTLSLFLKEDISNFRQAQITFNNSFVFPQTQTGSVFELSAEPTFQIPSYVQTQGQDIWCDQSKEECKVNISLEENLIGTKVSDVTCRVDFGFAVYDDCNPPMVTIPRGEHSMTLSISYNDTPDIVTSKKYDIHNTPQRLNIPSPIISIQSGIIQASSLLVCKNEKCSVNVSALDNFTGSLSPEKVGCEWDMGNILSSTGVSLNSCNPGYISFPEGVHTIRLKLYEKDDISNFSENFLTFQASARKIQVATSGVSQEERKIEIQSGLTQGNQGYICEKKECKVNVKFPSHTYEACTWNFGTGEVQRQSKSSCNPGIVSFGPGEHNISLIVTDEKTLQPYAYMLQFQNLFSDIPELYTPPIAQISVEGKLSKNKVLQKKSFVCYTQDTCSLNLSGKESFSLDRKNLEFYWDFGDGETSTKANPKAKKFSLGLYKVILKVSDGLRTSQDALTVEILKRGDIPQILEDTHIYSSLKIKSLFPNPEGKDSDEWIQLENTSWNLLHLKGLIIEANGGKRYTIEESIYLLPRATKKFYKNQTHLTLKNQDGEVSIWYNQKQIDSLSWSFPVRPGSIITRESLEITSQKVQVSHVIDGDTLSIVFDDGHFEKLRLIGVDTPETKHPKKKVQEFGIEAFEFSRTSLEGKTVFLQIEKQNYRDKYGRLLGYVRLDEQEKTFNQILIENGYARAYLYFPFMYSEVFKKAEKEAKAAKVGLWADKELIKETLPAPEPLPPTAYDFSFSFVFETLDDISRYFRVEQYIPKDLSRRSSILTLFGEDTEHKKVSKQGKKTTQTAPPKEEKIPFSLKLSLLKSGVKVSGKTKPFSLVKIHIFQEEISLKSDSIGKFSYLYSGPLVEGQQQLRVQVLSQIGEVLKEKEKTFTITPEYKTAILLKKQKAAEKLKKTKKKSTKKKSTKKVKTIPFLTKVTKNFQDAPQKKLDQDFIILLFFLSTGGILSMYGCISYFISLKKGF